MQAIRGEGHPPPSKADLSGSEDAPPSKNGVTTPDLDGKRVQFTI